MCHLAPRLSRVPCVFLKLLLNLGNCWDSGFMFGHVVRALGRQACVSLPGH